MPNEIVSLFDWLLSIIPDRFIRIILWVLGKIYYYCFNKTCGDIENSEYNGKFCCLSPGHYSFCKSRWEYNENLKKKVQFRWIYNFDSIYSRAEIKPE